MMARGTQGAFYGAIIPGPSFLCPPVVWRMCRNMPELREVLGAVVCDVALGGMCQSLAPK